MHNVKYKKKQQQQTWFEERHQSSRHLLTKHFKMTFLIIIHICILEKGQKYVSKQHGLWFIPQSADCWAYACVLIVLCLINGLWIFSTLTPEWKLKEKLCVTIHLPGSAALFNCSSPHRLAMHHHHRFLIISLTNSLCSLFLRQNSRPKGTQPGIHCGGAHAEKNTIWTKPNITAMGIHYESIITWISEWFGSISTGSCHLKLCALWLQKS